MPDLITQLLTGGEVGVGTSSEANVPAPNEQLLVRDRFGTWKKAEVIDTRQAEEDLKEFYVHYHGTDRRLDEWVGEARLRRTLKRDRSKRSQKEIEEKKALRARRQRSPAVNTAHPLPTFENLDTVLEQQHEQVTKVKYIEQVRYAEFLIDTWYVSPYPDEYGKTRCLHICDHCLRYFVDERGYRVHLGECKLRHPPGREIYREGDMAVFEVDGTDKKFYSQCLCLLAKLFLDHKTIYFDVSGFLFYVLCKMDAEHGATMAAYFSKEIESPDDNNLNCILVLPPFQQAGYGNFLIQLSYELSRRQRRPGSPEKPLSDLGQRSYFAFWKFAVLEQLTAYASSARLTVHEVSENTGMTETDIRETLEKLGLTINRKGEEIAVTTGQIAELRRTIRTPKLLLNHRLLRWRP